MKTAIEWLIEMLHSPVCTTFINGKRRIIPHQLILDAKEKHKKEIIEAYVMGSISLTSRIEAEDYYNQTYIDEFDFQMPEKEIEAKNIIQDLKDRHEKD
jgi:hypothetical protein